MTECLLATDTLSYYMKGDKSVKENAEEYLFNGGFDQLTISEINYYEIRAGLEHKGAKKQLRRFEEFTNELKIIKLTKISLDISANRFGNLKRKGIELGTPDLLIAGIALENDFTLVTSDIKHFQQIEGLKIENWKE